MILNVAFVRDGQLQSCFAPPWMLHPSSRQKDFNHKRMPVLLSEEPDFETWLTGSPAVASALASSPDAPRTCLR